MKIIHQRGNGTVEVGNDLLDGLLQVGVVIPPTKSESHEPCTGFHQTAGNQGALPPLVPPVAVTQAWALGS